MAETSSATESTEPVELGVHFETVREKIPGWLYKASAAMRQSLREHLLALETSRYEVQQVLAQFKSVDGFCLPRLVQALETHLNGEVEVQDAQFIRVDTTYLSSLFEDKVYTLVQSQTLLEAALQNFEEGETEPGAFSGKGIVRSPETWSGKPPFIAPEVFAALCRKLDLGRLYQEHIDSVFNPAGTVDAVGSSSLEKSFIDYYRHSLTVSADIAHMEGSISAAVHGMLMELAREGTSAMLGGQLVHGSRMRILGIETSGWVVIGAGLTSGSEQPCIAYMPGAPGGSIKYYSRFLLLEHDLTQKLRDPSFQQFFVRFVPEERRLHFVRELARRLLPKDRRWPPLPAAAQYFELDELPVVGDLFEHLHQQRLGQIKTHARQLVVPTADVDKRTRQARLDAYREAGLGLLTLVLSFVPLVGEVILAASVVSLVEEVYDGLQAWQLGDRHEALGYLLDVAQNVALFAAGALAVSGGRALFRPIKAPASVDSLIPVEAGDHRRLWRPGLVGYERDIELPAGTSPDEIGLYQHGDKQYLPLEDKVYAVSYDRKQLHWRVEPPAGGAFHAPPLKHNGAGTWQTLHAQPARWSALQLLQRLGRPVSGLGERILQYVRQLHGAESDALRRSLVDNQPPPALLLDTLKRFRIDQTIERFIGDAPGARVRTLERGDLQLRVLTALPGWPGNRVIHLFDAQGRLLQEYGVRTSQRYTSLQISESQLKTGEALSLSLAMLAESERTGLLGVESSDLAGRVQVLERLVHQSASQRRRWLFDALYEASEKVDDARIQRVLDSFPGLPGSVAKELCAHASGAEWEQLAERVPLRLGEEAHWYLKQVRLQRVCESWYLSSHENASSDRLVLHALEFLSGWPKDLRIELRKQRAISEAVEAVGPPQAATLRILLNVGHEYTVLDSAGTIQGTAQDIFDALLLILPKLALEPLEPGTTADGRWLRDELVRQVTRNPEASQHILGLAPLNHRFRPPVRLASGRIGYPMSDSGALVGYSERVSQRTRELYPGFSGEEVRTFIASLNLSEPACLVELERRREEYQALSAVLDSWVQRRTWRRVAGGLQVTPVVTDNKQRVAEAILACWRRQSPRSLLNGQHYHELDLLGMHVGDLPPMTADFSHVGFLFMTGMGLSSTELSFLGHFRQLRWLSLGFNHFDSLPEALFQMSELAHLHLPGNRIVMNAQIRGGLSRLTRLRFLNLSDNPLALPPDVRGMPDLEHLLLRHTQIDQWPDGLAQLTRLQLLDLRDNRIATIPESVYSNPVAINRRIHLHDNPVLSAAQLQRLQRYEQQTGISFGIDTPARQRPHVIRRTPSLQAYDSWSAGLASGQTAAREQQWRALFREQGASDFFRLLADLTATAEYDKAREALSGRVWQMLDAASQHTELREALFVAASHPQTCTDGVELVFSDMEVRTQVFRARVVAGDSPARIESNLLELARGLWRLDEVEALAQADIEARLRVAGARVDSLEVRLAYRVGLASRLGLPGQPAHMTFTELAQVSQQALDTAFNTVIQRESTAAYVRSLAAREFWGEHLKARYPERFEAINSRHQAAVQVLDARRTSRRDPAWHEFIDVELEAKMGDELRAWREAQREELEKLTGEILRRTPGA